MTDRIVVSRAEGIAEVRLNRPDKLNALGFDMFEGLIEAGEALARDEDLRAVILAGAGNGFCAGIDTRSFTAPEQSLPPIEERTHGIANLVQRAVMVWRDLPVPVLAALHGTAIGAGLNIALAADLRFAAPATRLAIAEINWGLIPAMGGSILLPGLVRDDVMRDLVYTGRTVLAQEALQLGLVTRVVEDPREEAFAFARAVAARNPDAIRAAKRLFRETTGRDEAAALALESRLQAGIIHRPNQTAVVVERTG